MTLAISKTGPSFPQTVHNSYHKGNFSCNTWQYHHWYRHKSKQNFLKAQFSWCHFKLYGFQRGTRLWGLMEELASGQRVRSQSTFHWAQSQDYHGDWQLKQVCLMSLILVIDTSEMAWVTTNEFLMKMRYTDVQWWWSEDTSERPAHWWLQRSRAWFSGRVLFMQWDHDLLLTFIILNQIFPAIKPTCRARLLR